MNKIDKLLLLLGFLIVIGLFTLAFVIFYQSGNCVIHPCEYIRLNNISCYNPYTISFP